MEVSKSSSEASVALMWIPTPVNVAFNASLEPEYNILFRIEAVSGFQVIKTNLDVGRPSSVLKSKSTIPYRQSSVGNAAQKSSYVLDRSPFDSITIVFLSSIL